MRFAKLLMAFLLVGQVYTTVFLPLITSVKELGLLSILFYVSIGSVFPFLLRSEAFITFEILSVNKLQLQ